MKLLLRWLRRAIAALALLAAAAIFVPYPLWHSENSGTPPSAEILVLSNPIHTDLAIPLDDALRKRFDFLSEADVPIGNPGAKYLVVGWGGRSFYLETPHWADIKPLPVLRALTLDRSVIHVDVAGNLPLDDPSIMRLSISAEGYQRMTNYILASFARQDGQLQPIAGQRYGKYDAFYEANGVFNALAGCNTWTARALREAGLRTSLWNPLPQTLAIALTVFN